MRRSASGCGGDSFETPSSDVGLKVDLNGAGAFLAALDVEDFVEAADRETD